MYPNKIYLIKELPAYSNLFPSHYIANQSGRFRDLSSAGSNQHINEKPKYTSDMKEVPGTSIFFAQMVTTPVALAEILTQLSRHEAMTILALETNICRLESLKHEHNDTRRRGKGTLTNLYLKHVYGTKSISYNPLPSSGNLALSHRVVLRCASNAAKVSLDSGSKKGARQIQEGSVKERHQLHILFEMLRASNE